MRLKSAIEEPLLNNDLQQIVIDNYLAALNRYREALERNLTDSS